MGLIKFSTLTEAPDVGTMDYFVGIRDNGDGTFTNYKYTAAELAAFIGSGSASKRKITVSAPNLNAGTNTLTDAFFSNVISEITTLGQTYIADYDFVQSGGNIQGLNFTFFVGQILIAKI